MEPHRDSRPGDSANIRRDHPVTVPNDALDMRVHPAKRQAHSGPEVCCRYRHVVHSLCDSFYLGMKRTGRMFSPGPDQTEIVSVASRQQPITPQSSSEGMSAMTRTTSHASSSSAV